MAYFREIREELNQQKRMLNRQKKAAKKDKQKAEEVNEKVSRVSESLRLERSVNHFSERISTIMKERRKA